MSLGVWIRENRTIMQNIISVIWKFLKASIREEWGLEYVFKRQEIRRE